MKNLWKKWIFLAQFHFQNPDPDPAWQFESGSNRIRNTGRYRRYLLTLEMIIQMISIVIVLLLEEMSRAGGLH